VHSLAGPDASGRIAFVENDMMQERHKLELLRNRHGNPAWNPFAGSRRSSAWIDESKCGGGWRDVIVTA
jgi:hypothetical protein